MLPFAVDSAFAWLRTLVLITVLVPRCCGHVGRRVLGDGLEVVVEKLLAAEELGTLHATHDC